MGCNCGKNRLASNQEYVVVTSEGVELTDFASEAQARVAAAKLGGVFKTRTKAA